MPVRSSGSSVLRWPDRETVDRAVRTWAQKLANHDEAISKIGYGGSYARGDWGPGSDVDIIVLLTETKDPFLERGRKIDATTLPVPADVLVYTNSEWERSAPLPPPIIWVYEEGKPVAGDR